jgi:Na+-transporting NADH:ubiquinone oxidoreductase subunit NqrF
MTYRMLILVLAVAALIVFPAANAIAGKNKDDVAIIKCAENNLMENQGGILPIVFQRQATFILPLACGVGQSCAPCLKALINDPFDCDGNDEFTSNVVVVQQSNPAVGGSVNIEKYVFKCEKDD